jgi:ribosomal protein S15P/S13E
MSHLHPKTGTKINNFNSHKENCFYDDTSKRQMFLIIEQMAELLKNKNQDWIDKAKEEVELLKINGIK